MTKYQELKNKANSIDEELDKLSFSGHNVERVLRKYWSLTRELLLTIEAIEESKNTIYEEVKQERQRQDNKFGSQPRNLKPEVYLAILTEEIGEVARAILEGDSENYREELIQVAAVAIAMIEEFDNGQALNDIASVCKSIKYRKDND